MFEDGVFPRDIALAIILLGFAGLALRRPWLGLLGLAVLSYMHPQGYAPGFMKSFPAYASLFFVVVASSALALARGRLAYQSPRLLLRDWRIYALPGLWLWFALTSHFSIAHWEAWDKFHQVARILPPLALTLLLIDDRRKLHALIVTVALSIMLIAIKGGYWAVITGFQDRVYGPAGSQYGDNNEFAVAVCMAIPLLMIWLQETRERAARVFIMMGVAMCYFAVASSWSRGGMLALSVVSLVLVMQSRRKLLLTPTLLLLAGALFIQLPESWFGRMQTLGEVTAEESAASRLALWRSGIEFTLKHPIFGGGFNLWPALNLEQGGMDWHSVYVKMAAEHGIVGLAIWAALLFGSVLHLARQAWGRIPGQPRWVAQYSAMLLTSLLAYLVGGATLGISYWEFPYLIVVFSMVLRLLGEQARQAAQESSGFFTRPDIAPRNQG
jgi:probable O-glycosylation ligase (exosortase A-associated)